MPACGSPRLIAACHVLLRLLLPRHPPCALSSLTIKFTRSTQERSQLSAISFQLELSRTRLINSMGLKTSAHHALKRLYAFRIPADCFFSLGTHKNLQPCRLPNLFSCQISSSLETAVGRLPLAVSQNQTSRRLQLPA
jgi:hypothetical protein